MKTNQTYFQDAESWVWPENENFHELYNRVSLKILKYFSLLFFYRAHNDFMNNFTAADEVNAKMANKYCNYIAPAVEECGNHLIEECNSEKEVNGLKRERLINLKKYGQIWDLSKCPRVK